MNEILNPPAPPSASERPTLRRGLFQAIILTVIMFSSLSGYLLVLKWRGAAARWITVTRLDQWLPFWPSWVWVYLIPYVVGPVLVGILTPATFRWFVQRGLVVVGLTLLIFAIFPTQIDDRHRHEFAGTGITAEIYRNVIEIDDPPANAAPSLHVSLTFLLILALFRDYPRYWPAWCGFVGLVWASTLVTRQHHVIDVATGVLLAWSVAWCFAAVSRGMRRT